MRFGGNWDDLVPAVFIGVAAIFLAAVVLAKCDEAAHCIEWTDGPPRRVTRCYAYENHICTHAEETTERDRICSKRDDR